MDNLEQLIGAGTELSALQMSMRAFIIFILALVLIKLAGRRAFGMRSPFDNVISILLGAVLSRAVVGASPFVSTLAASLVIVVMHRLIAWISLRNDRFDCLVKDRAILLYKNGRFFKEHMDKGLVTEKDILEYVHHEGNLESIGEIECAYLERDGKISVIKKKP